VQDRSAAASVSDRIAGVAAAIAILILFATAIGYGKSPKAATATRSNPDHPVKFLAPSFAFALVLLTGCVNQPSEPVPGYHTVTVQNTTPRVAVDGEIIDAHDGCLQFFDGRYYLYGTAYGRSAGFGINNRFRVYSSADLEHWRFDGELIQDQPEGVFYRPYVVYNPATKKYVLWFNWYPQLWNGSMGVAVSDTPVGPFVISSLSVNLSQADHRPGDGSLFVDDDGTGYFVYTTIGQGHAIRVEKLRPDFLDSTGETSEVLGTGCEAPAMFRRGETYYVLFDRNCCFCPRGSGARGFTARSPLGPYTERGNINRDAAGKPIIPAQQTFVATLPAADGPVYLWMGDQWGSRPDGVKGHDLQYWSAPLEFLPDGSIAPLEKLPHWTATVRLGAERPAVAKPYQLPKRKDPNPLKVSPCSNQPLPQEEWDTGEQP